MVRHQSTQIFDQMTNAWARFGQLVREVNLGLTALHRVQFDEPWKPIRKPTYGEW